MNSKLNIIGILVAGFAVASCDSWFEYPEWEMSRVERECDALGGSFIGEYNSGSQGACIDRDQIIFMNCFSEDDPYRHRGKCYSDVTRNPLFTEGEK